MIEGEASFMKVNVPFSFVVCLGMFHYSLWEMPVCGQTATHNLKLLY